MALQLDVLDGNEIKETQDGYEIERTGLVTDLTGQAHNREYLALQHPGVPRFGDPHPSIPGLSCVSRSARLQGGNDTARITLAYRVAKAEEGLPPTVDGATGSSVISIGSSLQNASSPQDAAGNGITLEHTFSKDKENQELAGRTILQGVDLDILLPQAVVSESRKETQNPFSKSKLYTGKVNSRAIWGEAPRTFLCTRLEGNSSDGGKTWDVTYEFQFNPRTWDTIVVFRDPNTQKPVEDPVLGKGVRLIGVYAAADFHNLSLTISA